MMGARATHTVRLYNVKNFMCSKATGSPTQRLHVLRRVGGRGTAAACVAVLCAASGGVALGGAKSDAVQRMA